MSITYNLNIPASGNNPSNDQPNMETNTNAINQWTGVDHVEFNVSGDAVSGTHLQVTFNSNNTPSGISPNQAVLFTKAGLANSGSSDAYLLNAAGTFPSNLIRAAGIFTSSGAGSQVMTQFFNCSSTVTSSGGIYAITLTSGVVTGNNVLVFTSKASTTGVPPAWSFSNPTLSITGGASSQSVCFIVLQI